MRCTSFYRCYPVACYPTAFDFLQFPLTSEAEDRDSIAERRCVNAATPIPPTNHNSIITLISALSAMGLPNQSFYSTHFVHGTMITVNVFSFRFDPFSIDKVSARSTPILCLQFYLIVYFSITTISGNAGF